jgi:16S rRNA (uracil1498-N3)-methyltransferase
MVFVDDLDRPRPDEADLHHLLRVRRLRPGERVVAADGRGGFVPCRIGDAPGPVSAGAVTEVLVVEGPVEHQARPSPGLTVAFAPVKGDRPEWVVQKLTEVGVDRIVVLRTARTVVRWEGERAGRAAARLATVAREAAAQSRRVWLPDVAGPLGLDEVGAELGTELVLARPGGGPPSLEHPAVAVGPEGGWDEAELARFPGSLGLGPTVLRAETAAVVAGALLCGLRSGAVGPPALA